MKTALSSHLTQGTSNTSPIARKPRLQALGAGAAAVLVLAGPPAIAQTAPYAVPPGVPAVRVRYGDLNLASPAGVQKLYARIKDAAGKVCPDVGERDLFRTAAVRKCRLQAIERAVRQVNNPHLAALAEHNTRS